MVSERRIPVRAGRGAIGVVFALSWAAAVVAGAQGAVDHGKTVRDGVYSKEQATRGRATYDNKCSECHDGGSMGPELWGSGFLSRWSNKSVHALYDVIAKSMPADAPGTLNENELLDVVAYVVQANGFPAGDTPLTTASGLETMMFVADK